MAHTGTTYPSGDGTTLKQKLLLCAAFFGTELSTSFEQIYMLLSLQYLGVPVSLVSVNGMVAGLAMLPLLPACGQLVDKGRNPKKRKMAMTLVSLALTTGGYLLLVVACLVKVNSTAGFTTDLSLDNSTQPVSRMHFELTNAKISRSFQEGDSNTTGARSSTIPDGSSREVARFDESPCLYRNMATNATVFSSHSHVSGNVTPAQDSYSTVPPRTNPPPDPLSGQTDQPPSDPLSDQTDQPPSDPLSGQTDQPPSDPLSGQTDQPPSWMTDMPNPNTPVPPGDSSTLPTSAIMAIIAFIALDMGYDLSMPMVRAFVLDHAHSDAHPRLLVLSTLMAAMGGTLGSVVGVMDLPTLLEGRFTVDGTAAMLIGYSVFLAIVIICSFACSILTARFLTRGLQDALAVSNTANNNPNIHKRESEQDIILMSSELSQDCNEKTLLVRDHHKLVLYPPAQNGISKSKASYNRENGPKHVMLNLPTSEHSDNMYTKLLSDSETAEKAYLNGDANNEDKVQYDFDKAIGRDSETCSESGAADSSPPARSMLSLCSRRLLVLAISYFLTISSSVTFVVYVSNALAIGVYGGDITASPGTTGYRKYLFGQHISAVGSAVMFLTYLLATVFNTKLFHILGERAYFLLCHTAMIVADIALLVWPSEELYFVAMVTYGVFRTCAYTVPYVLANKYLQEEISETSGEESTPASTSHAGRAMTMMGSMVPLSYLTLCAMMGPFMEVTGSVWLPITTSCSLCAVSMAIFSLTYLPYKRKI